MEPPVSEPIEAQHIPDARAAADPPLLPPGTRVVSQGLRVTLNALFSVELPMANSSRLVLPTITAPAASSFFTTVASYGARKFSSMRDEQVVVPKLVQRLSLMAIGTPVKGPTTCPASAARARSIAPSS